jgi:ligand-binding SRPBCC domain-containing protein
MRRFTVTSRLASPPAEVWEVVTTADGVNDELGPLLRMTVPRGASEPLLRTGRIGRSWVLLLGVLPVDYDDLNIASIDPGRGFRERSVLGSASEWHHDRSLSELPGGGCRVTDEIGFTPRLRPFGGLHALVLEAMFRWRHRRLRARFGVKD